MAGVNTEKGQNVMENGKHGSVFDLFAALQGEARMARSILQAMCRVKELEPRVHDLNTLLDGVPEEDRESLIYGAAQIGGTILAIAHSYAHICDDCKYKSDHQDGKTEATPPGNGEECPQAEA